MLKKVAVPKMANPGLLAFIPPYVKVIASLSANDLTSVPTHVKKLYVLNAETLNNLPQHFTEIIINQHTKGDINALPRNIKRVFYQLPITDNKLKAVYDGVQKIVVIGKNHPETLPTLPKDISTINLEGAFSSSVLTELPAHLSKAIISEGVSGDMIRALQNITYIEFDHNPADTVLSFPDSQPMILVMTNHISDDSIRKVTQKFKELEVGTDITLTRIKAIHQSVDRIYFPLTVIGLFNNQANYKNRLTPIISTGQELRQVSSKYTRIRITKHSVWGMLLLYR